MTSGPIDMMEATALELRCMRVFEAFMQRTDRARYSGKRPREKWLGANGFKERQLLGAIRTMINEMSKP